MIDLSRFTTKSKSIVPIVENWGRIEGRKINHSATDGWYQIELSDTYKILGPATPLQIAKVLDTQKSYKGYVVGTQVVPVNFNNWFKDNYAQALPVNFLNQENLTCADFILWEDGRFYYKDYNPTYESRTLRDVRTAITRQQSLHHLRGISPEIRLAYVLATLENTKQSFSSEEPEELHKLRISDGIRDDIRKQLVQSVSGRIRETVRAAGGTVASIERRGKNYLVRWRLSSRNEDPDGPSFITVIEPDFRVRNAGFCLSGEDDKHTIASLVNLAYIYDKDDIIHITTHE